VGKETCHHAHVTLKILVTFYKHQNHSGTPLSYKPKPNLSELAAIYLSINESIYLYETHQNVHAE
jgi:hypothetical protein